MRAQPARHRILVVGGGFGGATAARYLLKRDPSLEVTLVEPSQSYVTCPFSNLYLGGLRDWDSLAHGFDDLRALGVRVVHDRVEAIDAEKRQAALSDGTRINWDRLILSPGIDIRWGTLEGYDEAAAELTPHAWKAGPQTQLLQRQLAEMPDGGTFVMVIPEGAYRCPPGPYERAAMVAHYFKTHKPASKILLLDGKDQFSKQGLFQQGWKALYGEMIEWVGLSGDGQVVRVDARAKEVETAFGTVHRADVLNVIPPQQAGLIAAQAGVTDASGWAPVKGGSFASALVEGVHVLGDATIASPMPKSGFAANTQAKVAVAVILAELAGAPIPEASYANTCYSLIGPGYGISVAGVYRAEGDAIVEVPDSGGVSPLDAPASFREAEARYGEGWYASICRDIWGSA
ncbi:NAD(P)/FAD-dependent oxidoreductase [Paracoccus sulfuroxidans]|uniref:Sulfide dehydrogenase (Flavocytochrome c), flavoprotein subunit n=1 Tax=Paracoccus sulfuroxidans TaxID=384678 RepID=A0A562NUF3_9RHOB|nr:NAD(P)/FAD-dependent oxidoreductase [Paracoccus sulfuroxidans]TWI35680.1 sulfide dehydrogenase (flavocytochrome c), flavoprotein subunit [Paracoccus sulfuroxidans]